MDEFAAVLDGTFQLSTNRNQSALESGGDQMLALQESELDQYLSLCEQHIRKLEYSRDVVAGQAGQHLPLDGWRAEKSTWTLVKYLFRARLSNRKQSTGMAVDGVANMEGTDRSIINEFMSHDVRLSEYVAVKQWLEKCAPAMGQVELRKSLRSHTLREVSLDQGKKGTYCSELDPDGPLRSGRALHPQDASFNSEFVKTLFDFLRRGQLGKAIQHCRTCNEHWRAATLLGGLYYHDPQDSNENGVPVGNRNRGAWMRSVYFIANQTQLDLHERALYAALCGNVANVLPVCESWEDLVWAYFNSLVIYRSEAWLMKFPRIRGDDFDEFLAPDAESLVDAKKVFSCISQLPHDFLKRESSNSPVGIFRKIQIALITDGLDSLLDDVARSVLDGQSAFDEQHLRFLVHLILIMLRTESLTVTESIEIIISRYIDILIHAENYELVIVYASRVSYDLQVELMSKMLQKLDLSKKDRQVLLQRAYRLGMDVKEITRFTFFSEFSRVKVPNFLAPFDIAQKTPPSSQDENLVSAFQWLLVERDQFLDALFYGNALYRYFLLTGKIQAAIIMNNVLGKDYPHYGSEAFRLDIEQISSTKYQNMIRELVSVGAFLEVICSLRKWHTLHSRKPVVTDRYSTAGSQTTHQDMTSWKSEMKTLTRTVEAEVQRLLFERAPAFWLEDSPAFTSDLPSPFNSHDRQEEAAIIRSGYIPFLLTQLMSILYETRDLLAGNLEKALQLPAKICNPDMDLSSLFDLPTSTVPMSDPRNNVNRLEGFLSQILDIQKVQKSNI